MEEMVQKENPDDQRDRFLLLGRKIDLGEPDGVGF
jgi:hypothetical protein